MIHRVRTVIRYLHYGSLRKVLPKKAMFTGIKRGGSMPSLAKKIGYPEFGMFLDWYIRKMLAELHGLDLSPEFSADIPAYQLYEWTSKHYFNKLTVTENVFNLDNDYYEDIEEFIHVNFCDAKRIYLEPEWSYEDISGHPDLVIDDTIYDIKTTGQFNIMRVQTIFQLLSYYCLSQLLEIPVRAIGVVLPAQKQILRFDLHKWDWIPFWQALQAALKTKLRLIAKPEEQIFFSTNIFPYTGCHVSKQNTINKTLLSLDIDRPWQIFLAGRCQADFKISKSDIEKTRILTEQGYRFYVHAPYTLNISRYNHDKWTVNSLKKHLQVCVAMGCRGVVIHCGVKAKTVQYDQAYTNMYRTVIEAAEVASADCPVLIETSAKETGELLSDPKELITFYYSLPDETQKHTAICVDTCHVWSAGYDPMEFIQELYDNEVPIRLIHFNDSDGDIGCCKDRHAPIGVGYIGLGKLNIVGQWAVDHGVDMVYE